MPDQTAAPAALTAEGPGFLQVLLLLLYLALILVGVYYGTRFFARLSQRGPTFRPKGKSRFQPGRHIVLLDRLMLDRERSVLLLEAEGRRFLVGVSGASFVLLKETEAVPPADTQEEHTRPPFFDVLAAFKKQGNDENGQ